MDPASPTRGTTVSADALPRNRLWGPGEGSRLVGGIPDPVKHRVPVSAPSTAPGIGGKLSFLGKPASCVQQLGLGL